MKIFFYSLIILFLFIGCNKNSIIPKEKSLEELYPEWRYLTWVSTNDNNNKLTADPQLEINIASNVIFLAEKIGNTTWGHEYRDIKVTSTSVTFLKPVYGGSIVREYLILQPPDSTKVKLLYLGNVYVLQKH